MRHGIAPILLCATLAGCAATPPPPAPQPLGATESCVSLDRVVGRRVSGPQTIDFELLNGEIYRNRLATACPGMEQLGKTAAIAVTTGGEGNRLCRGDRVKVFDPLIARATGLGSYPACLLGEFTRIPAS